MCRHCPDTLQVHPWMLGHDVHVMDGHGRICTWVIGVLICTVVVKLLARKCPKVSWTSISFIKLRLIKVVALRPHPSKEDCSSLSSLHPP